MARSYFSWVIHRKDGSVEVKPRATGNLRTNVGRDWQSDVMGNSSQPASGRWLGLSTDTTAPAATDTSLTGEITTGGLGRALGTYAHTTGTATYTISNTFTSSATFTVQKEAVFNAISSGTMIFESLEPNPPTLVSGDTLTQTVTVSI